MFIWTGLPYSWSLNCQASACVLRPQAQMNKGRAITWVILLWLARNMERFCDSWID